MSLKHLSLTLFISLLLFSQVTRSQQKDTAPKDQQNDEQEPVKVFTEEVRLPVIALDQYGHYDPSVELDDILVLEDGVTQQVRSLRHIPASVLIVLDTGGELSGLGGNSKRTSLTREVAIELLKQLPENTTFALMQ